MEKEPAFKNWKKYFSIDDKNLQYLYTFVANGAVEVIREWFNYGQKDDIKDICEMIEQVVYNGVKIYLKR